jgi:hypothetical protein
MMRLLIFLFAFTSAALAQTQTTTHQTCPLGCLCSTSGPLQCPSVTGGPLITSTSLPKCEEGYQPVIDAAGRAMCARDLKAPK